MRIIRKSDKSIYLKTIKLLLLATVAAVVFLFIFVNIGYTFLDKHYESAKYALKTNAKYTTNFQTYVDKYEVHAKDKKLIDRWVRKNKLINVYIIKENELVYSYNELTIEDENNFRENDSMNIVFKDGVATVYFERAYAFVIYNLLFVISLILGFALFLTLVLTGLYKELKILKQLRGALKVIESGDLNHEVKVRGNDEFAELANSIDEMRKSLKALLKSEDDLKESNRQIIAEMSHDLRTPLTSILLYTELLKKQRYQDEEEMKQYIMKIDKKATQIKDMTDALFEYALTEYNKNVKIREEDIETTLSEEISNAYGHLLDRGYNISSTICWSDVKILMSGKYIQRIFDNLVSNIEKYADIDGEVEIILDEDKEHVILEISNKTKTVYADIDSNNVGLLNVSKMMEAMGGACKVEKNDGNFKIYLCFKKV